MFGRLGTQHSLVLIISYLDHLILALIPNAPKTVSVYDQEIPPSLFLEVYEQTSVYLEEPQSSNASPRSCHQRWTVGVILVSAELSLSGST